jgi:hypothetical protein
VVSSSLIRHIQAAGRGAHRRPSGLYDKKNPLSQEKPMNRKTLRTIAVRSLALVAALFGTFPAQAQDAKTPYPSMAPLEQYLMADRSSEIALARSAAPESISRDAEVMVLGPRGYETAIKGQNGFVCMVSRSWAASFDDPEFWNPKQRSPICFNPAGARSYLPQIIKKTDLVLAGRSKAQMLETMSAAVSKKKLPGMEPGAMGYMLSKQQYTSDRDGHWHPHLMFFAPLMDPPAWGASLAGSPILGFKDEPSRVTVFLIPVRNWSDGTADLAEN